MTCAITDSAACEVQIHPEIIPREAKMTDAQFLSVVHENLKHGGMQMKMEMAIHMVEAQSGGAKAGELFVNFSPQLSAQSAIEIVFHSSGDGIVTELPALIYEVRNFGSRQRGTSANQGEMQADSERWIFPGQRDRLVTVRFVDHETCSGKDAVTVSADDRCVDGG